MNRKLLVTATLLLTSPSWAADANVSGHYVDVGGDPIVLSQSGESLSVTPDMKELPEQARQFLGEIKLTGTIKMHGDKAFEMDAAYSNTIEPIPGMKLEMKVDFDATGDRLPDGLNMKNCEWKANLVVSSGGEIAGSENLSEKCVGLWKKRK